MNLAELAEALKILKNPCYGRNDQIKREAAAKVTGEIPTTLWSPPKTTDGKVVIIDSRVGQITTDGQKTVVVFDSKAKL
jgi:hypothetical protein